MEDTEAEVVTISDLLRNSLPLSAAASLRSSSHRNPPSECSTSYCRQESTNPNPKSKILRPLKHPVVLIGTVSLPFDEDASSSQRCRYKNTCFRFTDDAYSVCCDLLDFGFSVLGKKIRVLAFNFIPFKHGGGFLEIIKWTEGVMHPCSATMSFPLVPGISCSAKDGPKSVSSIRGTVESVGPVCVVPCSNDICKPSNVRGFLVEFLICECKLCKLKRPATPAAEIALENHNGHVYVKSVFVYFCGSAASCHPAITKLIGKVVMLTGLKKKLVYLDKEYSQVMYVITDQSLLHMLRMPKKWSPHLKVCTKGAQFGSYTGLVRNMYMQGMIVELDEEVWLVATDQQLLSPHSIRVGAVISVKNVHFVTTKLSGKKFLILGCCFKTSILVQSFSPFETRCHVKPEMEGLLCYFIASLAFSARLWILLTFSCFQRKFDGILSEKDILGSKRKEGLLQVYASSYLPSWTYPSRSHRAFMDICQHASSACGSQPNFGDLKLVVPLSLLIHHCEAIWARMARSLETVCQKSYENKNICISGEGACCCQSLRRIIPSEDVGVILFGNIKISPISGRLQFVDASGCIDALITDLPSTWNYSSIYEVSEYSLVIEGMPHKTRNCRQYHDEPLSCSSIFNWTKKVREIDIDLFICFNSRKTTCRRVPFDSFKDSKDDQEDLGGRFHIVRVVHIFPSVRRLSDDLKTPETLSMFVEVVVMPWDLFLARDDGSKGLSKAGPDMQNKPVGKFASNWTHVSCHHKRQKTEERSSSDIDGFGEFATHKLPCVAIFASSNDSLSGTLCRTKANISSQVGSKLYMEFKDSDICKYQLLQIGGYYIVNHHDGKDSCFCYCDSFGCGTRTKFLINSRTKIWSVSFRSEDDTQFPAAGYSRSNLSEVSIHIPPPGNDDTLKSDLMETESCCLTPLASTTSCSLLSSKSLSFGNLFPEGKLICVHGDVISVHSSSRPGCKSIDDRPHSRIFHGDTDKVSIHVSMEDNQRVEIFGSLRKHASPVGFGHGVNATFYRILNFGVQNRFMLTPISYIVVTSVKDEQQLINNANKFEASDSAEVPSSLISEFVHQMDVGKFRCRVISVLLAVLQKNRESVFLKSRLEISSPLVNIPIASFLVEDGSSSCICWANGEQASTLLRLHEKLGEESRCQMQKKGFGRICDAGKSNDYHLERILRRKPDKIITIKNYGPLIDSDQEFVISGGTLCSWEENLVEYIMFNASSGRDWIIVGKIMGAAVVEQLEKEHSVKLDMELDPSIPHVWVTEVCFSNPVMEARRAMKELLAVQGNSSSSSSS